MVRKFEVGGVYVAFDEGFAISAVKVMHVSVGTVSLRTNVKGYEFIEAEIGSDGHASFFGFPYLMLDLIPIRAVSTRSLFFADKQSGFYILHPFFPSKVNEYGCGELDVHFHKKIMRTFLVFFFSVKLIVLARRVKERMYTPGGIGFIAAQEDFDRATKSQRIG